MAVSPPRCPVCLRALATELGWDCSVGWRRLGGSSPFLGRGGRAWVRTAVRRVSEGFRDSFDLVHAELGVHGNGEIALEEIRRDRVRLLALVHRQVACPRR